MELVDKLQSLKHLDIGKFETEFQKISVAHNSKEDKKLIEDFFRDNAKKVIEENKKDITEISLKIKLHKITKILSLAYVSETYFKKSRQWFSQRLNNNIVNGKPAKFTEEELRTLDFALKDISKEIGSVSIL